jgi:hypothetical protein
MFVQAGFKPGEAAGGTKYKSAIVLQALTLMQVQSDASNGDA